VADEDRWVQVTNALVLSDANQVLGETVGLGIFGLFHAAVGSVSTLALSSDHPIQGAVLGSPTPTILPTADWLTLGTASAAPFVVAWNTTTLADGPYNLRAICAEDPTALIPFQTNAPGAHESGGSGSSNCFIATAAYGSPLAPQIQLLRSFRDTYLLPHRAGRWLVDWYYRLSPPIADLIRTHDGLRAMVRGLLTPVVWSLNVWLNGHAGMQWVYMSLAVVLVSLGWGTRRVWLRY
jgi:hypothetical protein